MLLTAVAVGVATTTAIVCGFIRVGRGDPALRVIISFYASDDLMGYASDLSRWTGAWPAGHFLIQGAWIRVLEAAGLSDTAHLAQGVLCLSVAAWSVALAFAYVLVSRVRGGPWGWMAVAGLLSLPLLTELSHNAYGEVYFLAVYLMGLWALVRFESTGRARWMVFAALTFLAASSFRTEAVVAAAGIAIVLLRRHGAAVAASFLALGTPLTVARIVLMPSLLLHQRSQDWAGRGLELATLGLYLLVPNGIVLCLLAIAFGSRAPGTRAHELSAALAAYAAASAGLLLAFFFGAMVLLAGMGPDSRFLAVPVGGILITVACLGTRAVDQVWSSVRRWIVSWVVLASCVQLTVLGVDYITDRPRPPREVTEAIAWLRSHAGPGQFIASDHIDWWEYAVVLYGSATRFTLGNSYFSSGDAPLAQSAAGAPPERVGRYLADRHPSFVVRAAPGSPTGRDEDVWGPAWSFLDAWASGGVSTLPEPAPRTQVVLENTWVVIYALEWTSDGGSDGVPPEPDPVGADPALR